MKKTLLASTALIGAALLTAPAHAGTVGSGDNLAVKLSGFMWFQANWLDEDTSDGFGRGYDFDIPETEVHISASNTADNGIKYGVTIEMEVNTDQTNNGDEVYAFVSGDFGRLEMGDQDDATNRMLVGAFQTHKGLSGPFGGLAGIGPVFHGANSPAFWARTDWQVATSNDRTKVIYFSPRFSGFQVGASFTPDSGGNGASFGEVDNNGSYENMIGLGLNFTEKFGDVGVSASLLYETAAIEDQNNGGSVFSGGTGANTLEDLEVIYLGAKVDFSGFSVGANYTDFGDSLQSSDLNGTGLQTDLGSYWALGAGYQQGPWGVSAWYSRGEGDLIGIETSVDRWGIGGRYAIAPGWQVRADYNRNTTDIEGFGELEQQAFILTNMFNF
jgi:predicted porin